MTSGRSPYFAAMASAVSGSPSGGPAARRADAASCDALLRVRVSGAEVGGAGPGGPRPRPVRLNSTGAAAALVAGAGRLPRPVAVVRLLRPARSCVAGTCDVGWPAAGGTTKG